MTAQTPVARSYGAGRGARESVAAAPTRGRGFSFGEPTQELVDASFALLREEVAHAREVLELSDLDTLVDVHGDEIEVRDVVVHMIEEYARHCGHADLLRECLDGRTGQQRRQDRSAAPAGPVSSAGRTGQ